MGVIVKQTRGAVRFIAAAFARAFAGAVPPATRYRAGRDEEPKPEWFNFPPF
jgi:hypothetical protein